MTLLFNKESKKEKGLDSEGKHGEIEKEEEREEKLIETKEKERCQSTRGGRSVYGVRCRGDKTVVEAGKVIRIWCECGMAGKGRREEGKE